LARDFKARQLPRGDTAHGVLLGDDSTPTGWQSLIRNDSPDPTEADGYAICARP